MQTAPRGLRLHIGIFGRRNVGKSSLLNALAGQAVSIVSADAGTTTDPVEKPFELQPIGPVVFIDTAGIDDVGALGALRVARTRAVLDRADVAIVVAEPRAWGDFERGLLGDLESLGVPAIVVFNKADLTRPDEADRREAGARGVPVVTVSALTGEGLGELRDRIAAVAPERSRRTTPLLADLVRPGDLVVFVTPIDREAPAGRIKFLQVQAIRDLLDARAMALVVKDTELLNALDWLGRDPALVVTDAAVFAPVAAIVPHHVPLTAFSILLSRFKGDLVVQTRGALAIDALAPGDPVLIAEACAHHPTEEDIGRVKIPALLARRAGGPLDVRFVRGHDFPEDLSPYRLVVHCGACLWNRREMLSRIRKCEEAGVAITNYGLAIAHAQGALERALGPFPEALAELFRARSDAPAGLAVSV